MAHPSNPKTTNSPLGERVRAWLSTEGFPFEMEVASTFLASAYSVSQGIYYTEEVTQKPREIDLTATTTEYLSDLKIAISVTCTAECKYSRDKPWVLLTAPRSAKCPIVGWGSKRAGTNESGQTLLTNVSEGDFTAQPFLVGPASTGYSSVTAFRGNSPVDEAFAAPLGAAKAARALAQTNQKSFSLAKVVGQIECGIWVPLVVLNGLLFTATLASSKNLVVKEIRWGRLLLKNPDAGGSETAVDIVTVAGMADYVKHVRTGLSAMVSKVRERPEIAKDPALLLKGLLAKRGATPTDPSA
jgi:hypothetical protein